ncbi:MAG TPA: hypothetical protein VFB80_08325 [Pirellulaceae bacterium]|nr:hypothetical protein [Pirellulaceae bacterium]
MKFTVRDLLWLAAVLFFAAGWYIDRRVATWERRVAQAKLMLAESKLQELGWRLRSSSNGREFGVEPLRKYEPADSAR